MKIRSVKPADAEALARIYGHYVRHALMTFDTEPPTPASMRAKLADLEARAYPVLVAEVEGQVAGFAYAGPYRNRPAYDATVEDAIYLDPEQLGQGIGRALLKALIDAARAGGYRTLVGVLASSADAEASRHLHRSLGFRHAGRLENVGHKHGQWLATDFYQLDLKA